LLNSTHATGKYETVHIARLKQFIHDSSIIPEDVAIKNNEMYVIEDIVSHQGSINFRKDVKFQVKLRGSSDTTWEPWENLRDNIVVHAYLRSNRMSSVIQQGTEVTTSSLQTLWTLNTIQLARFKVQMKNLLKSYQRESVNVKTNLDYDLLAICALCIYPSLHFFDTLWYF